MKAVTLSLLGLISLGLLSCTKEGDHATSPTTAGPPGQPITQPAADPQDRFAADRAHMVQVDLVERGIKDPAVLKVMGLVPREAFVLPGYRDDAYADHPLPIQADQTISQPYIVAAMTEALEVDPQDVVLEIGTGSGYQAAVLAHLVREVYTIEIVEALAATAEVVLQSLAYTNVHVKAGDGYKGWPAHAPFDGIIVTAAPDHVPQPLVEQLARGGRMIIPVGPRHAIQHLLLIEKDAAGVVREQKLMDVRFVPFTGEGVSRPKP